MIRFGLFLSLTSFALVATAALAADDISGFPGVDKLPAGYQSDGFVAGLGTPYSFGDVTQLPTKPLYWVYHDKIIGFLIEIDEKQIAQRVNLFGIQPIAGLPPIDHIDLEHSDGHGPWAQSTWELRVDFVSAAFLDHMTAP